MSVGIAVFQERLLVEKSIVDIVIRMPYSNKKREERMFFSLS